MPTDPSVLTVALAVLLLSALVAAGTAAALLRRTRRTAAADALSLRQELERLRHSRAELERTSYTDPLTGVWNYRYLQLALDREIARCARTPHPDGADRLSLLLVEVDGFDAIRREHGHQRGGVVLRDLAQRLAMEVREADVFGRYGGEEFLVLLPDTDAAGAAHVAERLRWTVRRHPLALPAVPAAATAVAAAVTAAPAPPNGLSATVGIAVLPRDGGHSALLLRAADRALAEAREPRPAPSGPGAAGTAENPADPVDKDVKDMETSRSNQVYSLLAQGCDLPLNNETWG